MGSGKGESMKDINRLIERIKKISVCNLCDFMLFFKDISVVQLNQYENRTCLQQSFVVILFKSLLKEYFNYSILIG